MGAHHQDGQEGLLPQGKGQMGTERFPEQAEAVYGMNDAPRHWCNILDMSLRSYGMVPTRADRCCCVLYSTQPRERAWEH